MFYEDRRNAILLDRRCDGSGRDGCAGGAGGFPSFRSAGGFELLRPLVLVNKENRLPASYVPQDLAYASSYGVPDLGGNELLREQAAASLPRMVGEAQWSSMELAAASGYCSFFEQQATYNYFTSIYGPGAGGVSVPPGACEHQLGTAIDLSNVHAGFVLSYTPGAQAQTGYVWEPWHWRYVGVENAHNIVDSGLTVRDYTAWHGVFPDC